MRSKQILKISGWDSLITSELGTLKSWFWLCFLPVLLSAVLMKDVREIFNLGFSLNFYMFQGGTNFGLIGGAQSAEGYTPVVTSYGEYWSSELPPT